MEVTSTNKKICNRESVSKFIQYVKGKGIKCAHIAHPNRSTWKYAVYNTSTK